MNYRALGEQPLADTALSHVVASPTTYWSRLSPRQLLPPVALVAALSSSGTILNDSIQGYGLLQVQYWGLDCSRKFKSLFPRLDVTWNITEVYNWILMNFSTSWCCCGKYAYSPSSIRWNPLLHLSFRLASDLIHRTLIPLHSLVTGECRNQWKKKPAFGEAGVYKLCINLFSALLFNILSLFHVLRRKFFSLTHGYQDCILWRPCV